MPTSRRARLRAVFADTRPLANPHFRRLWLANIVTVIGAQLTVVAVPAQIYALTQSSAMVGLAGLFALVPLVVFGLWGGALADHMVAGGCCSRPRPASSRPAPSSGGRPRPASTTSGCCSRSSRSSRPASPSTSRPGRRCSRGSSPPTSCPPATPST